MGRAKEKIDGKKPSNWKLLDDFRRRLAKVQSTKALKPETRPGGPERLLLEEGYFSIMLLGLFNLILGTVT